MSRLLPALLAGLLLAGPVAAQDTTFTVQHVAKLRMVTSAVVSPDGTQVAYVLSVPRQLPKEKDGPAWAELHVVDLKGKSTPYITGPVNVDEVQWTPDGTALSFLAKRDKDEHRTLYVIPTRGGEARKVVNHAADLQGYSWSPDGKRVAFLATEPETKEKKSRKDQGFSQEVYEEDVPPVRVWVAAVEGGKSPTQVKLNGSASELHWHPKEDRLLVAVAPRPLIDEHLMFRKITLVDLKTGQTKSLDNPGKIGQAAWSPDGKLVALISGEDRHDPKEGRLWVHSADGTGGWVDVVPNFRGHVESVAWKDDSTVVWQAAAGVQTSVGSVKVQPGPDGKLVGGERRIHVNPKGAVLATLTASDDGKLLAFTGHTAKHPPEVFVKGPDDKGPRRLTDSNPWLKSMAFAEQQVVKYKARDGLEIEGILIRPLRETKGQRYPLVLTVHGGPESHYSNGWLTMYHSLGQVGAARGMAVFYPNYRGSTGLGVKFSLLGQGEAAKAEFDDLVDGVDHLVKEGLVDAKKVGITGGSYGGYATAWGSTYYSDRFAAGVMFVGISDNVSKVGTTDIPHEMNLVHHKKWLWEDWDYFLKSSPIYYTDRAKTPLLILHGKADPRVHPSQSLELYRHLKLRGQAPVRLVFYPGEGHGNRRAASRLDYNVRLLRWMEHYLKGPGGSPPPYDVEHAPSGSLKDAASRGGWHRPPLRLIEHGPADTALVALHYLGRGCPCCIGP